MIEIRIPKYFISEFKYCLNCLFSIFLGIDIIIVVNDALNDVELLINNKKILLKNYFFMDESIDSFDYPNLLPIDIIDSKIIINSTSYPSIALYGNNDIEITPNTVTFHNDIIAGTFFMLSRWEEKFVQHSDSHGRFLAEYSVAKKNNFLHRPIVNEYVEILWALLVSAGYKGERKKHTYRITPTHDVDFPFLFNNFWTKVRSVLGQVKVGNIYHSLKYTYRAIINDDPYDTHELLMEKAEAISTKAHFNFMAGGISEYDKKYSLESDKIQHLFKSLKDRGHIIGFHPSYQCINDSQLFEKEKRALESATNTTVEKGRQHYLRFILPSTWRMWNNNSLKVDSTLMYADQVGFRCGVCYEFPVFDLEERKMLALREMPLIAMDVTLKNYQKLSVEQAIKEIRKLKNTIKKYNGNFVFLWHNSCLFTKEWESYFPVFEEMYK